MNPFGEQLKKYRAAKRMTLREISEATGRSVGFLCDVEKGRRTAPDNETIEKIERLLGVENGELLRIATKLRSKVSPNITQRLLMRPALNDILMRADDLDDEQLQDLLSKMNTAARTEKHKG